MIDSIFKGRHWQIFSAFFGLSFLQGIASELNNSLGALLYLVYIFCYVSWLMVLGTRLRKISPRPSTNYNLFIFVGATLIFVTCAFRLLGLFKPDLLNMFERTTTILLMMTYVLVSLIVLTSFVAKNLKTIEVAGEIDINDYFGDILGLIFWPIGIWTFQPRINKLAQRLTRGTA